MPKKTIRKEKSREYLERLLDNEGMTDKELVRTVVQALKSDNSIERTKALELASRWKGFADVDKKVDESVERLPIGNISLPDLDRLSNRCAYCRHKRFEPLREPTNQKEEIPGLPEAAEPAGPVEDLKEPEAPEDCGMGSMGGMLPSLQTDLPEEVKVKKEVVKPEKKHAPEPHPVIYRDSERRIITKEEYQALLDKKGK